MKIEINDKFSGMKGVIFTKYFQFHNTWCDWCTHILRIEKVSIGQIRTRNRKNLIKSVRVGVTVRVCIFSFIAIFHAY